MAAAGVFQPREIGRDAAWGSAGMRVPERYLTFRDTFAQTRAGDPTPVFPEAFHFDDNARRANEPASLVVSGRKRATAALAWAHDAEGYPVPRPGVLGSVTDFEGNAVCISETLHLDIVPLSEVSAEFAATEGEGDDSLAYWRRAHAACFDRGCERIGRTPQADTPFVCERFQFIFK